MKKYTVYILRTSKNTLYTGQTNDLQKRLDEHRSKSRKTAKYMRAFKFFTLVYFEEFLTRSEAMRREAAIKKLTKKQKERLVSHKNGILGKSVL
jgi:putative endonuclease